MLKSTNAFENEPKIVRVFVSSQIGDKKYGSRATQNIHKLTRMLTAKEKYTTIQE